MIMLFISWFLLTFLASRSIFKNYKKISMIIHEMQFISEILKKDLWWWFCCKQSYRNSQKKQSSCLLSNRFFGLNLRNHLSYKKISFPLLASVFEELLIKKDFSNWSTKSADFVQYADFSIKSQPLKKSAILKQ